MARTSKGERFEKEKSPFATTLRLLMDKHPITTQAQLSEITGKTRQTISQYVNGISEPGYDTLIKIADHFHVSIDYLLGRSDVSTADLTVQDIHKKTGLTEENIASLTKRGPYGEIGISRFAESYEKMTNDLISYASTHQASRIYAHFLDNAKIQESPSPKPVGDNKAAILEYRVTAKIISGIPEDGIDYTKGYTVISTKDYSRILIDEFLRNLRNYLEVRYIDSDIEIIDNGNE